MKKTLIGLALCLAATGAIAKGSSSAAYDTGAGGIITPEVAADGFRTSAVVRDKDGNMLVCPTYRRDVRNFYDDNRREQCRDTMNENAWAFPVNVVPRGKTYVGFKITPNGYYEFYWK